MKKFYVKLIGFIFSFLPLPQRLQNLFFWPLATRVLGKNYKQLVALKNGIKMYGGMEDVLTRFVLFLGPHFNYIWEPVTTRLLEEVSKEKKSILVAGSHIGYMALIAAKHSPGHVTAFEPVSGLYRLSQENFLLNSALNIHLEKAALGNSNGEIEMYVEDIRSSIIPYSGGHTKEKIEQVPIQTIDSYVEKKAIAPFDLIFLDIEGYEIFAMEGAEKTLRNKPDLILEVSPKILTRAERGPDDLYALLRQNGYSIYYIDDNYDSDRPTNAKLTINLIPIEQITKEKYNSLNYFNVFATTSTIEIMGL